MATTKATTGLLRGHHRVRELAHEADVARVKLETELLAELANPKPVDKIRAETLASAVVKARQLRRAGKSDAEQLRVIAQLVATA